MAKTVKQGNLRAARVQENEERIVRAAHRLFLRDGYQATTLSAVADAAGVAHRTVYVRFGSKAALLKRVVDVALVGDLAPVDVVGRDWYAAATSAPTLDERIAALAEGGAHLAMAAADVVAVARQAEHVEPGLAEAASADHAATLDAIRNFWSRAMQDGLLPPGSAVAWLTETSALLVHIDTYLLMREMHLVSAEGYGDWLATTLRRLAEASAT